ncbi:MAG: hypothetical protein AAB503_02185 [Patescibacteria group bacterium]
MKKEIAVLLSLVVLFVVTFMSCAKTGMGVDEWNEPASLSSLSKSTLVTEPTIPGGLAVEPSTGSTSTEPATGPAMTGGPVSVIILSPNGGEELEIGKTYRIRWNIANLPSWPTEWTFSVSLEGDERGTIIMNRPLVENNDYVDWKVPVNFSTGSHFKLKVKVVGSSRSEVTVNYIDFSDDSDSPFSIIFPLTHPPSIWNSVIKTGPNHTIAIPAYSPSINGIPLESGDYIGVFYRAGDGGLKIGGFSRWDGNGKNIAITAWGDNVVTTPDVKDGFAQDEQFVWKIWKRSEQKIYDAAASFETAGAMAEGATAAGKWKLNGLSIVCSLDGSGAGIKERQLNK